MNKKKIIHKCRWDDDRRKKKWKRKSEKKRRKSKELTVLNVFVQITNAVVPAFIYCDSVLFFSFFCSNTKHLTIYYIKMAQNKTGEKSIYTFCFRFREINQIFFFFLLRCYVIHNNLKGLIEKIMYSMLCVVSFDTFEGTIRSK